MKDHKLPSKMNSQGPLGFVLFAAYVGAVVYFLQQAEGFWACVWAFFKAMAWPGILIYQALSSLGV
jgi:hypothetical protein